MLCIPILGPTYKDVKEQLVSAHKKADLVELRLDCFESLDRRALEELKKEFPIPWIFTLRKASHGGLYQGSEEKRLLDIQFLAALHPAYFDLEYDISSAFFEEFERKFPTIKRIVSYHNFESTPLELEEILKEMQKRPAQLFKIATMARSSLDAIRMILFVKNAKTNMIGICMGEQGILTRILSPLMGNFFTFASLHENLKIAPGQLSIDELLDVYHYRALNSQTSLYALIGDPVDKSIGHLAHNAVFEVQHKNAVYVKIPLKEHELSEFFEKAEALGFRGLSVTRPHKEKVLQYLDKIDEEAQLIGAVNTIVFEKGRLTGYNTDAKGALDAIENKVKVAKKRVVVLGAGGAAKAIIYETLKRGAEVVVLNRSEKKADDLAEYFGKDKALLTGGLEALSKHFKEGYDILINTTPDPMPINPEWIIPGSFVMDIMVYPQYSAFLSVAQQKKCCLIFGYEMWINQALVQQKLWFKDSIDLVFSQKTMEKIYGIK